MAQHQDFLISVDYKRLKNLVDTEISFEGNYVTALLGPNGCGKSTVLHSLISIYDSYRMSSWFKPTSDSRWNGSEFTAKVYYKIDDDEFNHEIEYYKDTVRWFPRTRSKPKRRVYWVPVSFCVPEIEKEKKTSIIKLNHKDIESTKVLNKLSFIMNRKYEALTRASAEHGANYLGARYNKIQYSQLYMGGGEQKMFKMLDILERAPKFALIVIDEIETMIHKFSLKRFIDVVVEYANEKKLQIVFSTHDERIGERQDINIRHIYQQTNKTHILSKSFPETIYRLTGERIAIIEVYVEDTVSNLIIEHILKKHKILKYTRIIKFGSASNAFSVASTLVIKGQSNNTVIVMDGDVYETKEKKLKMLEKIHSGTGKLHNAQRLEMLNLIEQYSPDSLGSPDFHLRNMILSLDAAEIPDLDRELFDLIIERVAERTEKDYFYNVFLDLGITMESGYKDIIRLASKSSFWDLYVASIEEWISAQAQELIVPIND